MPDTPLVTYLKIQRAADREILAALRSSAANVSSELKRLQNATKTGEKIRREQLLRSQAAINRELAVLFDRVGDTVQAGAARAAEAGARTILEANKDLLREVLSESDYDYLVRSAEQSASNSLEALRQRVSGSSYVPLSQQVYDSQQLASGKIDEIVNAAIVRGASAAELAKDVRAYINPNTPGGVRYASLRLGRTELNNAFHAAQIKQAQEEPWTYGLKWNLSGSHPKPDECNEYADEVHYKDGEAGVFRPEEVPAKPHPNCLCYTTPEAPDPDEFIDQYMAGKYDGYLGDQDISTEDVVGVSSGSPSTVLKTDFAAASSGDQASLKQIDRDFIQTAGRAWEGTGYSLKVRRAASTSGNSYITAEYRIVDSSGLPVGSIERYFSPEAGNVSNEYFRLNPAHQGKGLASRLAPALEDWYRENGFESITLHANIDVGGYTWAKQGFGWDLSHTTAGEVKSLMRRVVGNADSATRAEAARWHDDLIRKMDDNDPSTWPTPYDLAMYGYTEGAESWPGKRGMLNSDWRGRKWL